MWGSYMETKMDPIYLFIWICVLFSPPFYPKFHSISKSHTWRIQHPLGRILTGGQVKGFLPPFISCVEMDQVRLASPAVHFLLVPAVSLLVFISRASTKQLRWVVAGKESRYSRTKVLPLPGLWGKRHFVVSRRHRWPLSPLLYMWWWFGRKCTSQMTSRQWGSSHWWHLCCVLSRPCEPCNTRDWRLQEPSSWLEVPGGSKHKLIFRPTHSPETPTC